LQLNRRDREQQYIDFSAVAVLQAKTSTKTDKFTMEIMKGRDDKRPLVSVFVE